MRSSVRLAWALLHEEMPNHRSIAINWSLTVIFLSLFCNYLNQLQLQTTAPIVDIVPSSPANTEELDDDDDDDDDDSHSFDANGDEPRRKTRRSRRGGYRRKRQQQKKVAALLAESAARRAQQAGEQEACCDNSTTTTDTESSSCESSTAGSSSSGFDTPPRLVARKRNNNININKNTPMNFHPVRGPAYQQTAGYNNGYPSHNVAPHRSSAHARTYNKPTNMSRNSRTLFVQPDCFLALDCEMVGVGKDGTQSALARISIVDYYGNVVMDEYIKPGRKVTDYRSFVSGITPEILQKNAKMDYATCRKKVIRLLRGNILVGHALENDLGILRINHPWYLIRDTAQYQPFMKVRAGAYWPRRLQDLAQERLHRNVQVYGRPHCPQEDAMAAMDLYKLVACEWEQSIAYTTLKMNETAWIMQQQQQQQYAAAAAAYVM